MRGCRVRNSVFIINLIQNIFETTICKKYLFLKKWLFIFFGFNVALYIMHIMVKEQFFSQTMFQNVCTHFRHQDVQYQPHRRKRDCITRVYWVFIIDEL